MLKERHLSIIIFSLFFSWLLAFPFEGQALYKIAELHNVKPQGLIFSSMIAHFAGLFSCGFFIKRIMQVKRLMICTNALCMLGSIPFFFGPSIIWYISLNLISFVAGFSVAAWGYFFKLYTPSDERIKTAADVLIYSNILMIIINLISIQLSPHSGLFLSMIFLAGTQFFIVKLPDNSYSYNDEIITKQNLNPIKPLVFLCLFIFFITINSGLMYQVVNPVFAHHKMIVSWYWAIPYIIALYIMKNLSQKVNRNYILYVAIAMMGFSFIAFMVLDNSVGSYFVVNTLMLGACGVYDLFWWSILGEMLDYHDNPAKILGVGLSANVLGVFTGGILGSTTITISEKYNASVVALIIVLFILMLLPLLNKYLSGLLSNHVFLSTFYEMTAARQYNTLDGLKKLEMLTKREGEIAELLLKGMTYKMIAKELFLSENTIKTHIKNIYAKLKVQNKSELLIYLMSNENTEE